MSSPNGLAYAQPRGSISDDSSRRNGAVPTLETPEGTWSPDASDIYGPRHFGDDPAAEARRGSFDVGPQRGQPLMRMQNRSTPALPTQLEGPGFDSQPPPLPGQPQDPTAQLNFGAMSIQDPVQRPGTSNSYRPGDARSMAGRGRGLPPHPYPQHGRPPPPHQQQWGPPPPGQNGGGYYDNGSVYSGRSSHFDGSSHGHDTDASSIRSGDSRRVPMGPPNGYMGRPPPPGGYGGYPPPQAIDVRDPPYTKEYVEDYRTRIKADPDPEAHFAYAKYLIDAAKRIGSDTPDDRQIRKYREGLITESLKVMRRLATQGETYADAQFFLANCHGTGMLGLQVDHERAYHLYLQAAKQNHPAACYRVGVCNDIGAGTKKDPARAFTFYRKAASLGDTAAMYKLGTILLRGGSGQPPNAREAVQWLKRAAEQADEENPHALFTLAGLHERADNEGMVIHDVTYAIELYTKAGQLGHVPSQLKLGASYEQGLMGCPVDPRKSIAWYSKAAEKGDPEAELSLSGWYLTGAEGILKQSDSEAYLWARKAANKAWPRAEYAVGYYAETGIGVQQDMELAKRWYMRAAAQGNKRAMARLTELKRLGNRRVAAARPTRQQAGDENCVIM
ncbi:hypothetical protein FRC01_007641 [Tulasnella sp. 417]|nr:hypothetical protein FRC01_007641 [Tulasnella sp. 417]